MTNSVSDLKTTQTMSQATLLTESELERFRAKIKKIPGPLPSRCWEWQGARNNKKYGCLGISRLKSTNLLAHRVSLAHYRGFDLSSDLCVLHKCDNPCCVNPRHLFSGSNRDNKLDMITKDRVLRGIELKQTKLTEQDVISIRSLANQKTQREIAQQYQINQAQVSRIINRKDWKHI